MALNDTRVLIAGASGAAAAAAGHLAAVGVPYIALVDGASDDGFNRADVLAARLGLLRPSVHADPYPVQIEETNATAIATGHDVLIDAAGQRATSLMLARACAELEVPLVHAAQAGARGAILVTRPGHTACLGCLPVGVDPALSGDSDENSALAGTLAGVLGAAAAADVAVLLNGRIPDQAALRTIELPLEVRTEQVERDPGCGVCGAGASAPVAATGETAR